MAQTNAPEPAAFTAAQRQVARFRPADLKAPNQNDLCAFVHAWFAGFDHIEPAEFFLAHWDDADMTFNMDGQVLAHDHASFRAWFADALRHIPWDFHAILDLRVTGTLASGWTAEFFVRHVGEWHEQPPHADADADAAPGRYFNRLIRANWRVEHDGQRFIIRRYELATAQTLLAQ